MPSADKNWLNMRQMGYFFVALALACPIAYSAYLIVTSGSVSTALAQVNWLNLWMVPVLAIIGALSFLWSGRLHARQRLRAQALAGDQRAMPPAAIKLSTAADRVITNRDSVALLWRPTFDDWFPYAMILLAVAMMTWLGAAFLENAVAPPSMLLSLAIAAPVVALEMGVYARWWRQWRRLPDGVAATADGLRWLRRGKSDVFIPWGEARLFEIWRSTTNDAPIFGYALMSEHVLIQWHDYPRGKTPAAADGADYDEMWRRSRAITQMIAARTGLIPRTCEPSLAVKNDASAHCSISVEARKTGWRWASLFGSALLLLLAAAPIVVAVGALEAPLTVSQPLNIYVAVTIGAVGLALLVVRVRAIAEIIRDGSARDVPRPDVRLPPAPPPGVEPLSLRAPHVWRDRGIALVIGLLIVGDIYALVRGYLDFHQAIHRELAWWTLLATFTTIYSLIPSVIRWALKNGTIAVADERVVRVWGGRRKVEIPWDMAAEIVITVKKGRIASYGVFAGDVKRTKASWPADALWGGERPLAPGESPAAVFAAAAVQRASVTPRVVYE